MKVPYTYLAQEFDPAGALSQGILSEIQAELARGWYTLGPAVEEFEGAFAEACGTRHAIGVNSGTDALFLALKALGVGPGDTVVTVPNTFIATVGAIIATGARPVFVDVAMGQLMEPAQVETALRGLPRPKAIIPVHWAGCPVRIPERWVGERPYGHVIEDACQAVGAEVDGRRVGGLGHAAAFSLHPLKNVNVWGDGGMVTTDDDALARDLRMLRNHGLQDRDTCAVPGYNSRLDTVQAIVGKHVLAEMEWVTERRIANARRYDAGLAGLHGITLMPRDPGKRHVYHLYVIYAQRRDGLQRHLASLGIESKVHYPVPLHTQPGFRYLGYKPESFPCAMMDSRTILSLPVHQYLTEAQIDFVIEAVRGFYAALPAAAGRATA